MLAISECCGLVNYRNSIKNADMEFGDGVKMNLEIIRQQSYKE